MLDYASITVTDLARAADFYDAITGALGYPCAYRYESGIGHGVRSGPGDDEHTYMKVVPSQEPAGGARHWALRAPVPARCGRTPSTDPEVLAQMRGPGRFRSLALVAFHEGFGDIGITSP